MKKTLPHKPEYTGEVDRHQTRINETIINTRENFGNFYGRNDWKQQFILG